MDIRIKLDCYISTDLLQSQALSKESLDKLSQVLTIDDAIQHIYLIENRRNIQLLQEAIGEKDVAIVFSNYFYDVYEKADILKNEFRMQLLFIDKIEYPVIDPVSGIVKANLIDVLNYIKYRKQRSNILYFSVHPVWRLVILYLVRMAFPGIKMILYKYDWLNLFCPYEYKDIMQRFLNIPMSYIESEYMVLDMILAGGIVDGIIYKDGGDDFFVLKDYPRPKLYFPAYLSKRLYQSTTPVCTDKRKFVYFGKLFSSADCIQELFNDAFLFEIFNSISMQDYLIDIYYVRSTEVTAQSYKEYFRNNNKVRFTEGSPLDKLLPQLSGRYHWGCLINNYSGDFSVIKQHVESAFPARIFSYMALGLPVVISEELKYSADFIRQNDIGIVVSNSDMKNLQKILSEDIDYPYMKNRISELRDSLSLENQQYRFIDFIHGVINN